MIYYIWFVFFTLNLNAQISPGKLYKGHSDLEGISNCTKCHSLGKDVEESKCLACHKELRETINLKRGYHSTKEVTSKKCWNCHGEHFGKNFEIIRFNEKEFNHNKSGYELVGSHKKLDCKKCHNVNYIYNKKLKLKKKTFLGLNQNCNSCHDDVHKGTLDKDCFKCHTMKKFSPAEKFEHNKTKFSLTGKHLKVKCIKCHKQKNASDKKNIKFKILKYSNCSSCHKDVHRGKLGTDCKSCHNTKSFTNINGVKNFNHNRTNFPLLGKHKSVSCKKCHRNKSSYKQKHERCLDCHTDYHKGEFVANNKITDCDNCHNEKGFSQSSFSLEEHNRTKFKLTGAHKAIACIDCHLKNDKWKFNINGEQCIKCHKNIHGNTINTKYFKDNKCETCHSTVNWTDIKFDHSKTKFELLGKHRTVTCSSCHFSKSKTSDKQKYFTSINSACTSCHKDIHKGQFNDGTKNFCGKCHTNNNWEPTLFNHNQTSFRLDGAHSQLNCLDCHKIVKDKKESYVFYKIEDARCISCH